MGTGGLGAGVVGFRQAMAAKKTSAKKGAQQQPHVSSAELAERLRRSAWARGLLAGVSAGALGVIAAVGTDFAIRVMFSRQLDVAGALLPEVSSLVPLAGLISLGAAIALMRFKANIVVVVLAAAVIGWTASFLR